MTEQWKTIKDYKYFEVSNLGRVREKLTKKIIVQWDNGNGYQKVAVPTNIVAKANNQNKLNVYYNEHGKRLKIKTEYVHRLVALAFIPNPENKPEVDHIDTDRANNFVDNLRWVTESENSLNSITVAKKRNCSQCKAVKCIETGIIYRSTQEIYRQFGKKGIRDYLIGKSKTYCGYHWEYI